jgi:ATP-dependent Clp protease adaptor protein ClpS
MAANVLLLNDDKTPMEFVVHVLETIFGKSRDEAIKLMLRIHQDGSGVCAVHDLRQAWQVAESVIKLARANNHPLRCVIEPD